LGRIIKYRKLTKIKTATMKKTIFTFLAFALLLSFSCEKQNILNPKPPDELPPATMTGANTFGCLVNGEVWRPYTESIWDNALDVNHDRGWVDCDQLFIGAKKKLNGNEGLHEEITINVWCPLLGENKITPAKGAFVCFKPCGCSYNIDTLSPHVINITKLDTINNIASGTFKFTAISSECQDTLGITEGRFDADSSL
jgi:hypothetical protein